MQSITNLIKQHYETPFDDGMDAHITQWEGIYCNNPYWFREASLGLGKTICQSLASQVLSEVEFDIDGDNFIDEMIEQHLLTQLRHQTEKAMATGGMVLRPYVSNGEIKVDFCRQGQFVPLAYDDDGNIIDIAFGEQIVDGKTTYTRIERQTFDGESVTIVNKAFSSKTNNLGKQIPLTDVDAWADIDETVVFDETEGVMFGYYRVPLANNVDIDSPLGISIFSPAETLLKMADYQLERLDWEYEGGQLAIDVSEDAILPTVDEVGRMDETTKRLYRQLDMNDSDTYHAFNPSLRDANYTTGLDKYLMRIEDTIGLSRGTLAEVGGEPRTATEMRILKQRSYNTIVDNQIALDKALQDLFRAIKYLANKYFEIKGDAELSINWNDSVLEDYQAELDRHLQRMDAGIESKLEVRMWAFNESEEVASEKLAQIDEGLDDIYSDLDDMGEVVE